MKQKSTTCSVPSKVLKYLRGFPDANPYLIKELEQYVKELNNEGPCSTCTATGRKC